MDEQKGVLARETEKQPATNDAECGRISKDWTEERIKATREKAEDVKSTKAIFGIYILVLPFAGFGLISLTTFCIVKPVFYQLARYIVDMYTHTGLEMRIPLINRTWTIVPKIWPDDSALSKIVAGTGSWPCQRDIMLAWLRRLRNGQRPYSPGVQATWIWGMMGMVLVTIFLACLDKWLDGHFDFESIGRWLAGVVRQHIKTRAA